jgi:hypothetical protein
VTQIIFERKLENSFYFYVLICILFTSFDVVSRSSVQTNAILFAMRMSVKMKQGVDNTRTSSSQLSNEI